MIEGLRWVVRKEPNCKRLQHLVYVKDGVRLLTSFVVRRRKGQPWVAVLVNGKQNLFLKMGRHESCRLWVQKAVEGHIRDSIIEQLEKV